MFQPQGRQVGVTIPEDQRAVKSDHPPNTVLHAVRCNMVACQYVDEYGRVRNNVLLEVGNRLYVPPNSESWAGALKDAADWLLKGVQTKVRDSEVTAPSEDTVDVLSSKGD